MDADEVPQHQRTLALLQRTQGAPAFPRPAPVTVPAFPPSFAMEPPPYEAGPGSAAFGGGGYEGGGPHAGAAAPHSPFNGPMSKTRVCRYYLSRMNNHFGRSCSYLHPCKLLLVEGHCKHGRRCTDDHVCRGDLLGPGCPAPDTCKFLHVRHEADRAAMLDMQRDWLRLAAAEGHPSSSGVGGSGFPRSGSSQVALDALAAAFPGATTLAEPSSGAGGGDPSSDASSNGASSHATALGAASPATVGGASPLLGPSSQYGGHSGSPAPAAALRMPSSPSTGSLLGQHAPGQLTASISVASFVSGAGSGSAPGSPALAPGGSLPSSSSHLALDAAASSGSGRLLCPFWYAETQSGCKAGQDCIFEHPGSIQLPDRPLPTPIQLRFATRAWERRRQAAAAAGAGGGAHGHGHHSHHGMPRSASGSNFSTSSPVLGPAPAGSGARGSPMAASPAGHGAGSSGYYSGHGHGHHAAHASSPLAHQAAQAAAMAAASAAAAALSHGAGGSSGNLAGGYGGGAAGSGYHGGVARSLPLPGAPPPASMSRSPSSNLLAGRSSSGRPTEEDVFAAAGLSSAGGVPLLPRAGSTGSGLGGLGAVPLPPMSTHLPPLAPSQSVLELQSLILGGGGGSGAGGSYLGRAARAGSGLHASGSTGSMGSPLLALGGSNGRSPPVTSSSPAGMPRSVSGLGLPDAALGGGSSYNGSYHSLGGGLSSVAENGVQQQQQQQQQQLQHLQQQGQAGSASGLYSLQPPLQASAPSGGMRRDSSSSALGLGLGLDTSFTTSGSGLGLDAPPASFGGGSGSSLLGGLGGLGGVGRDLSRLLASPPPGLDSASPPASATSSARLPPGLGLGAAPLAGLKTSSASLASLLSGLAASPRPGAPDASASAAASGELGLSFGEDILPSGGNGF